MSATDLGHLLPALIARGRHVTGVELRGSRARGDAGPFSDWDFVIFTQDPASTFGEMPVLVRPLNPLLQQWDRLSEVPCYMLMLAGPTKVDLIFEGHPNTPAPPWTVNAETLPAIDAHFWDWTLWLASKVHAGKSAMVKDELQKMSVHLLGPLGAKEAPTWLGDAIQIYLGLRAEQETRFGIRIDTEMGRQVRARIAALPGHG